MNREKASMMKATYTNPDHVATYVRSATHSWFGLVAVKFRSTRSAGRDAAWSGIVVRRVLPLTAPCRPVLRIRRSTVHRGAR